MKFKSLLLAAMAAAVITGCAKDDNAIDDGGAVTPSVAKAGVTLTISQTAPSTKAYIGEDPATTEETTISEREGIEVFAFEATGLQYLTYAGNVGIATLNAAGNTAVTEVFEVPEGGTYFYVFANVYSAFGDPAARAKLLALGKVGVTTRADFEQELLLRTTTSTDLGAFAGQLSQSGKFLMGTLWGNDGENLKAVIKNGDDPLAIDLKIGRFVSKVTLLDVEKVTYTDLTENFNKVSATDLTDVGTWKEAEWKIINVPEEKMYIVGNWTGAKPGAQGISQVVTPFYESADLLGKFNNYAGTLGGFNFNSKASLYTLENTHAQPLNGNSTAAHFMGTFVPETVLSAVDNTVSELSADGTFWAVPSTSAGKGYTFYNADPRETLKITDAVEYPEGRVHYIVYIQDPNEEILSMKYAVLRNHSYKLQIETINGLGIPGGGNATNEEGDIIPDEPQPKVPDPDSPLYPDPNTPIDEEMPIKVTIKILDWYLVGTQGIDF